VTSAVQTFLSLRGLVLSVLLHSRYGIRAVRDIRWLPGVNGWSKWVYTLVRYMWKGSLEKLQVRKW